MARRSGTGKGPRPLAGVESCFDVSMVNWSCAEPIRTMPRQESAVNAMSNFHRSIDSPSRQRLGQAASGSTAQYGWSRSARQRLAWGYSPRCARSFADYCLRRSGPEVRLRGVEPDSPQVTRVTLPERQTGSKGTGYKQQKPEASPSHIGFAGCAGPNFRRYPTDFSDEAVEFSGVNRPTSLSIYPLGYVCEVLFQFSLRQVYSEIPLLEMPAEKCV